MATKMVVDKPNGATPAAVEESREIALAEPRELATLDVTTVTARVKKVEKIIRELLVEDKNDGKGGDYGTIPGTPKPTLYKSGAEKIAMAFLLDGQFENVEHYDGDHLTVSSTCILYYIPTGQRAGAASGKCTTKESKYAYRMAEVKCPSCHKSAIRQTKAQGNHPAGFWCTPRNGGCGVNFKIDDVRITKQPRGQVPNDRLPDVWNTIVKMAEKRSYVAAVIRVTGASAYVTQDLEDNPELAGGSVETTATHVEDGEGAKTAGESSKAEGSTTTAEGAKNGSGASASPKNGKKKAQGGGDASAGKTEGPAQDKIGEEAGAECLKICEELERDPDEVLAFYQNLDKSNAIESFADLTTGMYKHFQKTAENARKEEGAKS